MPPTRPLNIFLVQDEISLKSNISSYSEPIPLEYLIQIKENKKVGNIPGGGL